MTTRERITKRTTMKSAILYAVVGREPDRDDYRSLTLDNKGRRIWIRCVIVNCDVSRALDKARPRKGEIVLNSIPL